MSALDGVQIEDRDVVVDAATVGKALGVDASVVHPLIRAGEITTVLERGIDGDAGTYRITFFYRNRRARLVVSDKGEILRRSTIDFGDRAIGAKWLTYATRR